MTVGSLGSILPEIILLIGGLMIILLDTFMGDENDSGTGYMAISVFFLLIALVGAIFQIGVADKMDLYLVSIDPFSTFTKLIIFSGMAMVAIAGGSYMNRRIAGRGEFWSLFLFVSLAMSLAVSADNLILIFLAIEFLSITSYLLVGFVRDDLRSSEAGVKYFLFGSIASSVMLYGLSLIYGATGSLDLTEIGQIFATNRDLSPIVMPATVLALVGLGFKTSLAPFHQWAPDTYDGAATPVTAYLSTVSKATGFAVMARVLIVGMGHFQADWVPVLAGLSILTMSIGNLVALRQTNVKRMLAYSSVAQAGYILMGLVAVVSSSQIDITTLGMNGLNGLLIYLFAYLFTNIGAFLVVMAIEDATGNSEVDSFNGLAQRSPALAWAMFIFMLSLTGIPLTGGFMGKFYVFGAAVQHQYYWMLALALINSGIAAYFYLNVVRAMFFGNETGEAKRLPVAIPLQIVVTLCLVATLYLGIYPPKLIEWADDASQQLLALLN